MQVQKPVNRMLTEEELIKKEADLKLREQILS